MKVLFITANFAPRGASPAIRTVNLVKAMVDRGASVKVITYDETTSTTFSPWDEGLVRKVPESVTVQRIRGGPLRRTLLQRSVTAGGVAPRKRSLLRNPLIHLMIPDPHVESVLSFTRRAREIVRAWHPDAVITFAYPFSLHLVGYLLKGMAPEIVWTADYGDPWTGPASEELKRPRWRRSLDRRIESLLLRRADIVSVTTDQTMALYRDEYPALTAKLTVSRMGYDPSEFAAIRPVAMSDGMRRLVHAGRLYSDARDASPFIHAVQKLWERDSDWGRRHRVTLIGEIEDSVRSLIDSHPSRDVFEFIGWVGYEESLAWMKAAAALVLVGNRGTLQIPGKLFNYLGAQRPLLLTCENEDDPARQLMAGVPGVLAVPNTAEAIERVLTSLPEVGPGPEVAERFSWSTVASGLLAKIQQAMDRHGRGAEPCAPRS